MYHRFVPHVIDSILFYFTGKRDKIVVQDLCSLTGEERHTMAAKIQEAQEAILEHANGKKFSRNVVCVEIISSDCQDLSLIDLPGLIESSDTQEDEIYIELILGLVRDYLAPSNTSKLLNWFSRRCA